MQVEIPLKIRNVFTIQIKDAITEEVKREVKAFNTITELFKSTMAGGSSPYTYISFGRGTGVPSMADTKLFNAIATITASTDSSDLSQWPTLKTVRTIRLPAGSYNGENITEVGLGASSIYSHAMIVDSEGEPISIQKTSIDIIDIYVTVYIELIDKEENGKKVLTWLRYVNAYSQSDNTSSAVSGWLLGLGSVNNYFRLYTGAPVIKNGYFYGGSAFDVNASASALANVRKITARFAENSANGPIGFLTVGDMVGISLGGNSIWGGKEYLNKHVGLSNGVTKEFSVPQNRYSKGSLVVKQNGIVVPKEDYVEKSWGLTTGTSSLTTVPTQALVTDRNNPIYRSFVLAHPTNDGIIVSYDTTNKAIWVEKIEKVGDAYEQSVVSKFELPADLAALTLFRFELSADGDILILNYSSGTSLTSLFDFNAVSNSIGARWTKHANFPATSFSVATAPHLSAFGICLAYNQNANIFSFSLNKETKVFGENITKASSSGISWNPLRITPTPIPGKILLDTEYTSLHMMSYEPSTGTFGTSSEHQRIGEGGRYTWLGETLYHTGYRESAFKLLKARFDIPTNKFVIESNIVTGQPSGNSLFMVGDVAVGSSSTGSLTFAHIASDETIRTGSISVKDASTPAVLLFGSTYYISGVHGISYIVDLAELGGANITFKEPLPEGVTVTADYAIDHIPKDVNHILDLEATFTIDGA